MSQNTTSVSEQDLVARLSSLLINPIFPWEYDRFFVTEETDDLTKVIFESSDMEETAIWMVQYGSSNGYKPTTSGCTSQLFNWDTRSALTFCWGIKKVKLDEIEYVDCEICGRLTDNANNLCYVCRR